MDEPGGKSPSRLDDRLQLTALAAEIGRRFQNPKGGGRSTDPVWSLQRLVRLSPATMIRLVKLAQHITEAGQKIAPMQVAALLIEHAARQLSFNVAGPDDEDEMDQEFLEFEEARRQTDDDLPILYGMNMAELADIEASDETSDEAPDEAPDKEQGKDAPPSTDALWVLPLLDQYDGNKQVESYSLSASGTGTAGGFPPYVILNEGLFGGGPVQLTFSRDDEGRGWLVGLEGASMALRRRVRLVVKYADETEEVFLGANTVPGGYWLLEDSNKPVVRLVLILDDETRTPT